jgi:hypothetical protein
MKINIPGKTPMERLTNLTKRVITVPKQEIEREERQWKSARKSRRRSKT